MPEGFNKKCDSTARKIRGGSGNVQCSTGDKNTGGRPRQPKRGLDAEEHWGSTPEPGKKSRSKRIFFPGIYDFLGQAGTRSPTVTREQ